MPERSTTPSLVIDTMIARGFGTDGAGHVDPAPFVALRRKGIRIHLADGAAVELLSQVERQDVDWPTWTKCRRALSQIVDKNDPVLLGGGDGLASRASAPRAKSDAAARRDETRIMIRVGWNTALKGNDLKRLRGTRVVKTGGRTVRVGLDIREATKIVDEQRQEWTQRFDRLFNGTISAAPTAQKLLPARGDPPRELFEAAVAEMAKRLDTDYPTAEPPPLSVRLDAFVRVFVLHWLRRLRLNEPYNAAKNANDVFDHDLLRYLAYPVAICTKDGGIHCDLQTAAAIHADWVLRPEDIADPGATDRLRDVAF